MRHPRRRRYWMLRAMRLVRRPLRVITRTTAAIWDSIPGVGPLIVWSSRAASLDILPHTLEALARPAEAPLNWLRGFIGLWRRPAPVAPAGARADLDSVVDLLKARGAVDLSARVSGEGIAKREPWREGITPAHTSALNFSPRTGVPILEVGGSPCAPAYRARAGGAHPALALLPPAPEAASRSRPPLADRNSGPRDAVAPVDLRAAFAGVALAATLPAHLRVAPRKPPRPGEYTGRMCDSPRSPPGPART